MKTQVLKARLTTGVYTAVFDDQAEYPSQYTIYWTGRKHKIQIDKVWSMKMVLATLSDIENGFVPQVLRDKGFA